MLVANIKNKINSVIDYSNSEDSTISQKIKVIGSNIKSNPTIISRDLKIEGDIVGSGIIEIEGSIKGVINGNSVVLREDGKIEGTIIAESLNLRGKFNGIIKAKNISISSKAKVQGDIEYESLSVDDGAYIDGNFKKLVAATSAPVVTSKSKS